MPTMIRVDKSTYGAVWAIVAILIAAGWIAYGMVGEENRAFLTTMVIVSVVLGAGTAVVLQTDQESD
jgi:hypothetical protein